MDSGKAKEIDALRVQIARLQTTDAASRRLTTLKFGLPAIDDLLPSQGLQNFYDETLPQLPSARDLSAYASAPDVHGYQADEHHYAEDEAAPADHDYQETRNPGRRTTLVAVMAIFGLVVVGSAGAFGRTTPR